MENEKKEVEENARKSDRTHGTKMVLEQYIKWLDLEDEQVPDVSSPKGNLHVIILKVDLHILVSLRSTIDSRFSEVASLNQDSSLNFPSLNRKSTVFGGCGDTAF